MKKTTKPPIDEIVAAIIADYPSYRGGLSSAELRRIGKKYRDAHPGWTTAGLYDHATYVSANRLYYLVEGVQRAEKTRRRMKRQAAAYARKQAKKAAK